jgi:hypothetical protein
MNKLQKQTERFALECGLTVRDASVIACSGYLPLQREEYPYRDEYGAMFVHSYGFRYKREIAEDDVEEHQIREILAWIPADKSGIGEEVFDTSLEIDDGADFLSKEGGWPDSHSTIENAIDAFADYKYGRNGILDQKYPPEKGWTCTLKWRGPIEW